MELSNHVNQQAYSDNGPEQDKMLRFLDEFEDVNGGKLLGKSDK
jgi:hypothetical protein